MIIDFAGESSRDSDDPKAAPSRLVNCFSESHDGQRIIKPVLGVASVIPTAAAVPLAAEVIGTTTYAVIGTELHEVTTTAATPAYDFVAVTNDTSISGNNGTIVIVTNGITYTWDGSTMSQQSPGVFTNATDVTFFAQRTVILERGGRRVQWSGVADPTSWNGLDFATTETKDDNNLRAIPLGAQLWIFKERSIELWSSDALGLLYIPGSTMELGLRARNLVVSRPGGIVWVGSDGKVHDTSQGVISTASVETAIEDSTTVAVTYYRDEGHEFACVVFSDRPALCFNLATGEWHERASGDDLGPWVARRLVENGSTLAFPQSGGVQTLGRTNSDLSGPLHRRIASRTLEMEGARFRVPKMEIVFNTGNGGLALYRVSRDRGQTWSGWREIDLGDVGKYGHRAPIRRMGQFRTFNIEVATSDTVGTSVWGQASMDLA